MSNRTSSPVAFANGLASLGLTLALVPIFTIILATAAFWLNCELHGLVIGLCSVIAADILLHGRSADWRGRLITASAGVLIISLTSLFVMQIHDFSFDGQTYHQLAVIKILEGWNPFRDPPLIGFDSIWVNSYTKGPWLGEAVLASIFGSIEAGKALNLILGIAAFLFSWSVLLRILPERRCLAAGLALLLAANPVLASQSTNFYVDSLIGSILLIALSAAATLLLAGDSKRMSAVIGVMLAALTSIKFSGLGFAAVFLVVAGIALLVTRGWASLRAFLLLCVPVMVLLTLVMSWNPYGVNYLQHGHPFYPLRGEKSVDILTAHAGAGFLARDRLSKLAIASAATSQTGMNRAGENAEPRVKLPLSVSSEELRLYLHNPDIRIGGFGPLFSAMVLASLLCALAALRSFGWDPINKAAFMAAGAVLTLVLAFPEPWWARYAPHFWLVPVLLIMALAARSVAGWRLWLWRGAIAVVAVNLALVWGLATAGALASELSYRNQVRYLRTMAKDGVGIQASYEALSARSRLAASGVAAKETPGPTCKAPMRLINSFALLCIPEQRVQDSDFTPQAELRLLFGL